MLRKNLFPLIALFASVLCTQVAAQPTHEFRGVWIATVDNIDWPKRGDYEPSSQRADYIRQLDLHKKNGMNAVIVQVRPAADALYPSSLEPWSQWLTGKQGKAPSPFYDRHYDSAKFSVPSPCTLLSTPHFLLTTHFFPSQGIGGMAAGVL